MAIKIYILKLMSKFELFHSHNCHIVRYKDIRSPYSKYWFCTCWLSSKIDRLRKIELLKETL